MHRQLLPAVPVACLLLGGCGDERTGASKAASDATTSGRAGPPTATGSAPSSSAGLPGGFTLGLGYDEVNGDDGSRVVVTHRPATRAFDLCGATAWDPEAGTADVLGVEFRGEAEWSRGRTLVLYPDQDDAVAAVETARAAVAAGPEEPAGGGAASTVHTTLHVRLGDESEVWIDRFRPGRLKPGAGRVSSPRRRRSGCCRGRGS